DYKIELELGTSLRFFLIYKLTKEKGRALKEFYLDKNLSKGFIRASLSPIAVLVIFVKKPGGGLCFYIDY
ncbi:uncharacterized protein K441DRAFT_541535, partial [Cenococcum geophilum 1.58]|uniref:uncharacterized protein n=1 Tax=Cenococcum geophilum 1.58 TaxID=794803 RepID=UPI00358F83D6